MVMTMFFSQWVSGFMAFVFPVASPIWRKAILPLHGFMGCFIYMCLCFTSVSTQHDTHIHTHTHSEKINTASIEVTLVTS